MHVKEFQVKKHLLLPTVEHIDDIGDVAEMESDDEQLTVAVAKGLWKLWKISKLCELQLENYGYFGSGRLWVKMKVSSFKWTV